MGGSLPLAPGVSTVRYPIPERIFDYVSTVRSATAGTCDEAKFGGALLDHVVGEGEERIGHCRAGGSTFPSRMGGSARSLGAR